MQRSTDVNELAAALAKAQGQIQDAKKDSSNPFFHSKYADLASVWEACRTPLSSNGLAVVQTIEMKDGKRTLETTLIHSSGQWIASQLDLVPKEETAQSIGSAITYNRRYALSALVGVCPDDDDGEDAMARGKATVRPAESKDTTPKPAAPVAQKPTSGSRPSTGSAEEIEKEFSDKPNPLLAEALKCQTGAALCVFAGKQGISVAKFVETVGCDPTQIKYIAAAAKALFGG